jgi:prophage regulatory protein
MTNKVSLKILRKPAELGIATTCFYELLKSGLLPKQVLIGPRAVGWFSHEIDAVLAAIGAGCDDNQIKELVKDLESRKPTFIKKPSTQNGREYRSKTIRTAKNLEKF